MELGYTQKRTFYEQGYLHVPGVVPPIRVQEALKAIHHSLGHAGIPPEKLTTYRSQSYCPEIQSAPAIADLLNKTPAWELAESLVGTGNLRPVEAGQVALRFPTYLDPPPPPKPHIDGMHSPHNGVPEGEIYNFTMLVGVLLSDVVAPYGGNFTVWGGTHHQYEAYFRENDPKALLNGMPPIEMPEPTQIIGQAGDIVLAHYQLAHSAAVNISHTIRYAVFFRLMHVQHQEFKWEAMTDIWKQWDGMREIAAQYPR